MALTPREREVLNLYDSGFTLQDIATKTGLKEVTVGNMVSRYSATPAYDLIHARAMARASAALAASVNAAGGHGR